MQKYLVWASPGIFVLLWSTGFIGARLGLPHAEPFGFLFVRFAIVLFILSPFVFLRLKKHSDPKQISHSMIVGMLLHAVYLGGVFFAIDRGMPAGISALIVSLQPIITLLLAAIFLRENVPAQTIILFLVGLVGVGLVIGPNIAQSESILPLSSLIACAIAVIGISIGTVYQKRYTANIDLLIGLGAQYFGATIILGLLAYFTENLQFDWTGELVFALFWLIFVLSLGAVGLLMFLINRTSVTRVSALFFLVPGFTLIVANMMFGETMSVVQLTGLVIASGAVGMVTLLQK